MEAVEAEGVGADAIAIPVTKPCWPPRYMRRSPASAEYKDSIALETAMQEAPAVRTKDFHIEADHIAVDRTEPDHTGAAATELDEHSAHKSDIEQKPQHQRGQRESKPSCPRQTDGNKAAQQRANAIPIPLAVNQILSNNLIVSLIRHHKPRHAIELVTLAEKQCCNHHKRTNQRGIPTKTTCYAIAHAANPTVMSTLDLAGTNPREETAAAGRLRRTVRRLPMIRLSSRRLRPCVAAIAQRTIVCIAHGSITATRACHMYRGTP